MMNRYDRRDCLRLGAVGWLALSAQGLRAQPRPGKPVTPEMFGARGDGSSDDTDAFKALGEWLSRHGGIAQLRRTVYRVGRNIAQTATETAGHSYTFLPARVLYINGARAPVRIVGNGATLRAARGYRFGTFAPNGRATKHVPPYYGKEVAAAYYGMVEIENCRAAVEIVDLRLDGNMEEAQIGGPWGDAGYQLPGSGLILRNNAAPWRISRVYSFHHPLDGMIVDEAAGSAGSVVEDCDLFENGRQGVSLVGGEAIAFVRTKFRRTRRGTSVKSPPGAGLDIEGEGKEVRAPTFVDCEFSDNEGGGMIAAEGRARGASFTRCKFVGTTYWSAWPNKPGFAFDDCTFVGAMTNVYGSTVAGEATRFRRCRFTDDPALSPTGQVYGRDGAGKPIVDLSDNPNVLFDACRFDLTGRTRLPWSTRSVIYKDCTFSQKAPEIAYTRGTFIGTTTISGEVTITDSLIRGRFIRNGQLIAPGSY